MSWRFYHWQAGIGRPQGLPEPFAYLDHRVAVRVSDLSVVS
jgi:hypothetical protein